MPIQRDWDPEVLEEIRRVYLGDRRATLHELAAVYKTSSSTIHNIVHHNGRFNTSWTPNRLPRNASHTLFGQSAGWWLDKFVAQQDEKDSYDGLHRLSEASDWVPVLDDLGYPADAMNTETTTALMDICNVLYYRDHRIPGIRRMSDGPRKEGYIRAGKNYRRDMAIAFLWTRYNLSLEFFARIFDVSTNSIYLWCKQGRVSLEVGLFNDR